MRLSTIKPLSIRELLYSFADLLAPKPCILCGAVLSRLRAWCDEGGRQNPPSPPIPLAPDTALAISTSNELLTIGAGAGVCPRCVDELCTAANFARMDFGRTELTGSVAVSSQPGRSARPAESSYSSRSGCTRCSRALISELELCSTCRNTDPAFARAHALFEYRGAARKLLWFYKFENRKALAPLFAALLYSAYSVQFAPAPIVPIPGQKRARAARGWDQMEVLARILRRRYGVQVLGALRRSSTGTAQKSLGRTERLKHAAGHYQLAGLARNLKLEHHPRVVLLDDVLTTGATASACSGLLHQAGVPEVQVLTLTIR